MSHTYEELTANSDDDFKDVIERLKALFVKVATDKRGRATHTYGVGARGHLQINTPIGFPESEFFTPGRIYPIILRHSRPGGQSDDRTRDGAATSIKFFEPGSVAKGLGIHDIMMNTGRALFVNSARSFCTMVYTPNSERVEKLLKPGILNDQTLAEGYRDSGSYSDYYYHSQICFEYFNIAGNPYYLRYRMINADRAPECGRYSESFRSQGATFLPPWEDDDRSPDYLKDEFTNRVRHGNVRYLLQVQLHPTDDPEALNCSQVWDEIHYPWIDVANLHLTEVLTRNELDELELDANRTPDCIKLPLATSADDYASLGHCRALVYSAARKARADASSNQTAVIP